MDDFFSKKNIIITGATSGLGRSLSLTLGKYNANLLLISKSKKKLLKLKKIIDNNISKIVIINADLSKKNSPKKIYNISKKYFKDIDVIINNAGIGYNCFVTDIDKKIANEVFQINFFNILETNKLFLNSMIKKNKGTIVNISSLGGARSIPTNSVYCASKFALEAYTESLRSELKTTNINVINVRPSVIDNTNYFNGKFMNKNLGSKLEKKIKKISKMSPDIAAKKILKSITKKSRDLNMSFLGKLIIILNSIIPSIIDILIFQLRKNDIISNLKKIQKS